MNELKRRTLEILNNNNQDWKEIYQEAAKNGTEPDFLEMTGRYSQSVVDLDQAFIEFKERANRKKGFFSIRG